MRYMPHILILSFCLTTNAWAEYVDTRKAAIQERIKPIGTVILTEDVPPDLAETKQQPTQKKKSAKSMKPKENLKDSVLKCDGTIAIEKLLF